MFVHPSDELYGADRVLLDMVDAARGDARVPALEVWLPADLEHPAPELSLCGELERRGVTVRHLDLPVLRRAYRTPVGLAQLLGRAAGLLVILRRSAASTVYCTGSGTLLAAPVARAAGVGRVVGHVQEIWSRADRAALRFPALACSRLLAISSAAAGSLPPGLAGRTTVVPNGTPEPPRVVPLEGREGPLRFVVASRWNGWKGHATLLEAWDRTNGDATLVVLGGPPKSGARTDVPALVAGLAAPGSVEVVGGGADTSSWVEGADVVVVPSDAPEPFGLVAIEAFARGRPVVASAGGGLRDIVTDGVDGWLFPPGDADALAAVLRSVDRSAVAAAGRRARRTYEERFTERAFAERWLAAVLG